MPPPTFDLLTLKVVSESRVTSAASVPILVFLARPLCSRLRPNVSDRQTDRRQTSDAHHRLMPTLQGRGHNNTVSYCTQPIQLAAKYLYYMYMYTQAKYLYELEVSKIYACTL